MKYKILFLKLYIMNDIKTVWLLHFIGNIMSWWLLGILLTIIFLVIKKDIDENTKKVCYKIINFNLSFWIYFWISFALMFLLIWFITTPILYIIWLVILILGFIKHLAWEDYDYPMSIEFLK